jgi:hypothetical protein
VSEPAPEVFDFRLDREAVDPWGVLHVLSSEDELPLGWYWRDEPERPEAA